MHTAPGRLVELAPLHNRLRVFRDRAHAGAVLAGMLADYRGGDGVVLAIPAGGVPVAVAIARELGLPLDVAVVSKLTLPWNTEAGYGALAFDGTLKLNDALIARAGLTDAEIDDGRRQALAKVERRVRRLRGGLPFPDLRQRVTILVDDGLASGFTLMTAIEALRRQGAGLLLVAIPTAHADSVARVRPLVDAVYCPNLREGASFAVADAYEQWSDVEEDAAVVLLNAARKG